MMSQLHYFCIIELNFNDNCIIKKIMYQFPASLWTLKLIEFADSD